MPLISRNHRALGVFLVGAFSLSIACGQSYSFFELPSLAAPYDGLVEVYSMNNSGQVAATATRPVPDEWNTVAYFWNGSSQQAVGPTGTANRSWGTGINDAGQITGLSAALAGGA